MTPGCCTVCGATTGRYSSGNRRHRCDLHRGGSNGRFDTRIAALVPRRGRHHTLDELAEMVGCTRQYVSYIEIGAMAKLRARAPWLVDMLRAS